MEFGLKKGKDNDRLEWLIAELTSPAIKYDTNKYNKNITKWLQDQSEILQKLVNPSTNIYNNQRFTR